MPITGLILLRQNIETNCGFQHQYPDGKQRLATDKRHRVDTERGSVGGCPVYRGQSRVAEVCANERQVNDADIFGPNAAISGRTVRRGAGLSFHTHEG